MSPVVEAKVEQEAEGQPMEVDSNTTGFILNDLVRIVGTKQKANNGKEGLIYAVDDLSHGHHPRHNVATILLEPPPGREVQVSFENLTFVNRPGSADSDPSGSSGPAPKPRTHGVEVGRVRMLPSADTPGHMLDQAVERDVRRNAVKAAYTDPTIPPGAEPHGRGLDASSWSATTTAITGGGGG